MNDNEWKAKFPGTALTLQNINASFKTKKKVDVLKLSRTKEGRIELAKQATATTKKFDEACRAANATKEPSTLRLEIKARKAERREQERAIAAAKKAEQAEQSRYSGERKASGPAKGGKRT